MRRRDLIPALVGATLAILLVGGVAWASIPAPGGVIQGCYGKIGGVLRVIDTAKGQKCLDAEVAINWNQTGPKGATGAAGAAGAAGAKGDPGPAGATGAAGAAGAKGDPGPAGEAGAAGAKGDTGATGAAGAAGAKGDPGPAGEAGAAGAKGDKGDPGLRHRASWSPFGDYPPGDVVERGGSAWVATEYACCGDEPGVSDKWSLLAAKGDTGQDGHDGAPGQVGQPGQPGATGPPGPPGPPGPAGTSGYEVIPGPIKNLGPFEGFTVSAECTSGKHAVGGGFFANNAGVDKSYPAGVTNNVWFVAGQASAVGGFVHAYVICVNV